MNSDPACGAYVRGVADGIDHVRADERAEEYWNLIRQEPGQLEESMQEACDNRLQ